MTDKGFFGIVKENMKVTRKIVAIFLISIIFTDGCTIKYVHIPRKPPLKVAVLPMENLSNDVNGPVVIRKSFNESIARKGYITMDLEEIDRILRDIGITDGGQIRAFDNKFISEKLGVNVLIFGEVVQYFQGTSLEIIPPGLVYKREVKAHFKMIDISTEKVMWENEHGLVTKDPLGREKKKKDDTEHTFFGDLVGNVLADTIKSGLEILSDKLAKQIADSMPLPYYY